MMWSSLKTLFLENFLGNDLGMRNFLPNGVGMIRSPANLWRHRKFCVAGDLTLTVEHYDAEYVHECLLGSTVSKKSIIMNVLKVD